MEIETKISEVRLSTLEKIVNDVRAYTEEDVEITFEFVIASLFPDSWKRIQAELSRQYTLGYIKGTADAEKEISNKKFGRVDLDSECCD